jgi:hypothetical protein
MSTESKHTGGPWHAHEAGRSITVRHASGTVCKISITTDSERVGEGRANSLVLAAAPELLNLLTKAREWVELGPELPGVSIDDEQEARDLLAAIDAALAKAGAA